MTSPFLSSSFWKHVDELRYRLIRIVLAFFIACFICFNFSGKFLPWLVAPAGHLVFTSPGEAFGAHMLVAMILGSILSAPYVLYHIWAFVASALNEKERRAIRVFGPLSLFFFIAGLCFAWFVAIPMSYGFLMSFSSYYLEPMITVDKYLDFVGNMLLAFGATFELPLVLAFLAKIGIATPAFLIQKRRHAIIIILIIAAILTPPDVVSQVLLAIPLVVLYEVGIIFVKMAYKHKTL